MRRVLGLLVVLGIVEIVVLIESAGRFGGVPTFLALVVLSAGGAWVVKRQGAGAWRRVRGAIDEGRVPAAEVMDAALLLVAGVLLLLPGFVSDLLAVALAAPPIRRAAGALLVRLVERRAPISAAGSASGYGFRVGEVRFQTPTAPRGTPGWVRQDDVIDLDAEEVVIDRPARELNPGS